MADHRLTNVESSNHWIIINQRFNIDEPLINHWSTIPCLAMEQCHIHVDKMLIACQQTVGHEAAIGKSGRVKWFWFSTTCLTLDRVRRGENPRIFKPISKAENNKKHALRTIVSWTTCDLKPWFTAPCVLIAIQNSKNGIQKTDACRNFRCGDIHLENIRNY